MNRVMKAILDEIDQKFKCLRIDFEDKSWRKSIPREAGWYLIKTNTPIATLHSVKLLQETHHINIPETIEKASELQKLSIAIKQNKEEDYVVYSGEAQNLNARAREHERGHPKTYCLGLKDHTTLLNYRWTFCYVPMSECKVKVPPKGEKLLRLAIEQTWRAKHGWPILCNK